MALWNKAVCWVLYDVIFPYYFSNYISFQILLQNLMMLGVGFGIIYPLTSERGGEAFLGYI